MTSEEREQIRRDAKYSGADRGQAYRLAAHCVALLDALEQAERERDEARQRLLDYPSDGGLLADRLSQAEARLSANHVLVEALSEIDHRERRSEYASIYAAPGEFAQIARNALRAYQAAQEPHE